MEAGLSYWIDGLMILGGVVLTASEPFDGPAGGWPGRRIGAGIEGIEYNAENTNSDGTVNSNWSWSGYGENLGIGAATGFVSGGIGVLGGAVLGAAGGAVTGAFDQFLNNAASGQSLGNNVGAAAGSEHWGSRCLAASPASSAGSRGISHELYGDLIGGTETPWGMPRWS